MTPRRYIVTTAPEYFNGAWYNRPPDRTYCVTAYDAADAIVQAKCMVAADRSCQTVVMVAPDPAVDPALVETETVTEVSAS